MRDASRLFHEHFAYVLTARVGFTRSEAQPTLFVDIARNVVDAVHVDDLVVGEMKQYFTMTVTPPLSASSTQTYVGARYLRHHAIWDFADHTVCVMHAERTRHEECKTCGHFGFDSQR